MSGFEGFEQHEALVAQLRATAPVAPERLRQRVMELAPAPRRRFSSKRRLVLVVAPVAAALAVGAAFVHGFVSLGRNPQTKAGSQVLGLSLRPNTVQHTVAGSSATTTPSAAQNDAPAFKAALAPDALAGRQLRAPGHLRESLVIPKGRLVHADASLVVQVPNSSALSHATNQATQIASSLGGYAQSVQYQSSHKGYGSSYLALRVPVGKAETAIGKLSALGTLVSQQVSTEDLQQQLTRQTNGIGSLRRAIAVYEQALKSGSLSASERVQIQIKLANARHAVTVLRKARSQTVASGAMADISLTLTTNKHAIVAPGHHESSRFDRLLGSAAGFLALEGIIVLYALVVLSPVLILGGLAWWLLRERRRRDERRLLAST